MQEPAWYAVLPANVRYDKSLPSSAKLLYAEITALKGRNGFCDATSRYFADCFGVDPRTIRRLLNKLVAKGYISVSLEQEGGRQIQLPDTKEDIGQKCPGDADNPISPHKPIVDETASLDHQAIKHFEALKKKYPGPLDKLAQARLRFIGQHREGLLPLFHKIHAALTYQIKNGGPSGTGMWPSFGNWIMGQRWESRPPENVGGITPECRPCSENEAKAMINKASG